MPAGKGAAIFAPLAALDLSLRTLSGLSGWAYVVIFLVCAGDAIFPVLPSEGAVIFGAILATRGQLSFVGLVACAAAGAVIGDNVSYLIGRAANRQGKAPEDLDGKVGDALGWAEAALETRGAQMIVVARFIPGGRTAITFGSGYLGYSHLRFLGSTVLAGVVWAIYATLLGYLGGRVFEERWWAALLLGVGVSLAVAGLIQLVRKLLGHDDTSLSDKRKQLQRQRQRRRGGRSDRRGHDGRGEGRPAAATGEPPDQAGN